LNHAFSIGGGGDIENGDYLKQCTFIARTATISNNSSSVLRNIFRRCEDCLQPVVQQFKSLPGNKVRGTAGEMRL